ncbi:MAG TPA: hypothetical protein VJN18_01475 [Polyangiaceae bacterium]|nr:hypothetical protein [Polyangiaceae bacterium]
MASSNLSVSNPAVTKRSLGLAGLTAFGACAACCALPLLAAAGVGGSLLSTIAGYIRPGADLVVAGAVGVGVLAVLAMRARKAQQTGGCDVACSTEGSCGCSPEAGKAIFTSADPAADEPVVCTADLRDKPTIEAQMNGYRAAFAHLRRTERFTRGFRWVFESQPGLEDDLRRLAENEHQCCRFFKFEVSHTGDAIVWQITADERAASVLEEFSQLPARLSRIAPGQDLGPVKQAVTAAGLVFAADRTPSK